MPILPQSIGVAARIPKYEFCRDADWWKEERGIEYPGPSEAKTDSRDQFLEREFSRLSKLWKDAANSPQSSLSRIIGHPAYLEIISYGEEMIPYVLRDLQKEPNHWFIALKAMTKNFSPVKPEDAGNMKKMTDAWLEWGHKKHGKIG